MYRRVSGDASSRGLHWIYPWPVRGWLGRRRQLEELTRALDDLLTRGLMTILSAADIATESLRARRSTVPELFDTDYVAGMWTSHTKGIEFIETW